MTCFYLTRRRYSVLLNNYENNISNLAKTYNFTIALPESRDPRMIAAWQFLLKNNAVKRLYLFLSAAELAEDCRRAGFALAPHRHKIIAVKDEIPAIAEKTLKHIMVLAKNKNKNYPEKDLLTFAGEPLYQAGFLSASGLCKASVAGAVATSAAVIKAGLATVPLTSGITTLSSSFVMVRSPAQGDDELLLFADCGVVAEPSSQQLADIAGASCRTWQALHPGLEPVVAFLSFSTKGSAEHPSLSVVREGLALFQHSNPEIVSDGELQFDAAFSAEVGLRKSPRSPVPGKTRIYIFPSLAAGNIAYKIAERLGGFSAYGPILQGFSRGFSDLSRGCSPRDIVMSVYYTIILNSAGPSE